MLCKRKLAQMTINLETNRLHLRKFRDDDCDLFSAYRSDPLVAKYQSWDTHFTRIQASQFIQEMKPIMPGSPGEWCQIAIDLKNDSIAPLCLETKPL